MKKLNNKGFSLGTMIAFICFFLVILIAIAIIAYNSGIGKKTRVIPQNNENRFVLPENE